MPQASHSKAAGRQKFRQISKISFLVLQ
uniref:Uncharacterized protein n=1 Tax=Anguilla anguilla TaxID=7936 RepID=A0A0E9SMD8_ANGAN